MTANQTARQLRHPVEWSASIKRSCGETASARFLYFKRDRPSPAQLGKCERGVAMVEYAILAAGIAVALVVALGGLGASVSGKWGDVNQAVAGPTFNAG